jgi:hypothetical protein
MGLDGQRHAPAAMFPEKGPGNNCTGGRVGTGPVGRVRKILPSPEFELRTVQPVASRHTDNAIPVRMGVLIKSLARPGRKQATATEDFDFRKS